MSSVLDGELINFSQTEEHLKHLALVFEKCRQAGIKLKISKCEFFKNYNIYDTQCLAKEYSL